MWGDLLQGLNIIWSRNKVVEVGVTTSETNASLSAEWDLHQVELMIKCFLLTHARDWGKESSGLGMYLFHSERE